MRFRLDAMELLSRGHEKVKRGKSRGEEGVFSFTTCEKLEDIERP